MISIEGSFRIHVGTVGYPLVTHSFELAMFFDLDYNHLIWLYSVWKFRWLKILSDYYYQFYDVPF